MIPIVSNRHERRVGFFRRQVKRSERLIEFASDLYHSVNGIRWRYFQIFLNIIACCLYVYSTYVNKLPESVHLLRLVIYCLFALDYVIVACIHNKLLSYIFLSIDGIFATISLIVYFAT